MFTVTKGIHATGRSPFQWRTGFKPLNLKLTRHTANLQPLTPAISIKKPPEKNSSQDLLKRSVECQKRMNRSIH